MAKQSDTPESNETPATKPVHSVTVYPFEVAGRVFEVDLAHLSAMRSRKDAKYIGTIPFLK